MKTNTFRFQRFSKKQRQVLNWWTDSSPVNAYDGIIADGAIRSGKTICMSLSFVLWAMSRFRGQSFAMCGKTIGSFRRNVLLWLKLMLAGRGYNVADKRADNLIVIEKDGVSNNFYIFGGKDERSQDLIQGITLAGVFLDEVALMPESFVTQATGRCSVDGSKFWFNCNPDSAYHWFKTEWMDKAKEKRLITLHFTMEDNLSLSERVRERYRSMYSGVFYKRYILGMWCMAEGVIYDMFDEDRHAIETSAMRENDFRGNYYVACDYGTQNPTAFLLCRQGTDGNHYVLREYYYSGRTTGKQKTDADFSADLKEWLGGINPRYIVLDPAAASFRVQLERDGFRVKKANNDVLDGIRFVASSLNKNAIFIDKSCTNLLSEFSSYIWDERAADRGEDKPVKEHDHALDALRYYMYTIARKPAGMNVLK